MYKKIVFSFIFFFTITGLHANESNRINFEHLNVHHGLSHYTVNALYQDENGMIWIGTRDGLNKFDGNEITVYKQITNDTTALFGNNIRSIHGDKNGHLFLLCKSGFVVLDMKNEQFRTIKQQDVSSVSYGLNNAWYTSVDTIFSYNPQSNQPNQTHLILPDKTHRATYILETQNKLLYVSTNESGILVYDSNLKVVKKINISHVVYMYEDSKKNIWVCTRYDGLYKIDFSGDIKNFRHQDNNINSLPNNFVRTICEDDFGNYWVGLFVGLAKFNSEKEQFTLISQDNTSMQTAQYHHSVWCILNDNQGTLWIGSYYGGIDLFNPRYSIFKTYLAYDEKTNMPDNPIMGRMVSDQANNLWIGTEGSGIYHFNYKEQYLYNFLRHSNHRSSISNNTIKSLWLDEKNQHLWIGTHLGGLNKLNLKTKDIKTFKHNPLDSTSIPNNAIRQIIHKNDTLYLATHNSIGVFDLKTEKCNTLNFKNFNLSHREIRDLYLDSKNRLWFSISNHVFCLKEHIQTPIQYQLNNNVLVFYENHKGEVMTGTDGDGVYYYHEDSDRFNIHEEITSKLASKYIIDIKESMGGYYYFATNAGIVIMDDEFKLIQNLSHQNGFPLIGLNENSIFISSNNEIYVGGINGLVSFNEKDLIIPNSEYKVNITDIRVNNEKLRLHNNSILETTVPFTKDISLKPKHSVITILFATTNYISLLKTGLQYKLEGFDKEWINTSNNNSVTYTNLNPGNYTFRIRGNTMTETGIYPESTLSIKVLPPFYKTKLAYTFYFILLISLIVIVSRFYSSKIKLRTSLEYEKKEKQHIEDLNQAKLSFFTNISHEFRTPITLITSQVDLLLQLGNIPQKVYTKLLNISTNTNRLKKLINELIDFRKYEQGYLSIQAKEQDFIHFIKEIFLSFKDLANSRNISYTLECKEEEIALWYDEVQLEKVFYNLISNAFKFTPDNGSITIKIEKFHRHITVSVDDTGIGIDKASIEKIFDRFYQVENKPQNITYSQGAGIGLSLAKGITELHHGEIGLNTKIEKGSSFWVKLLLGSDHLYEEQKSSKHPDHTPLELENNIYIADENFTQEIRDSQEHAETINSTILIVEDNVEMLDLLKTIFSPIYHVITASNGQEGIDQAIKHQPDIILSDVMMPVMSGVEMCEKLKTLFDTSHIPVVLLTARTAVDYMLQGLMTGADDYITKPFNHKLLITRCNNLVNSRKALQKKFNLKTDNETLKIATNSIDQQLLDRAINIVEENINNSEFDVNMFASELHLSRTNLFNKLKGITGQTPNEFIINIKLKKSLFYLEKHLDMSIEEIAYEVGFNSASYFIKKFGQLFGKTPTQYRKTL